MSAPGRVQLLSAPIPIPSPIRVVVKIRILFWKPKILGAVLY